MKDRRVRISILFLVVLSLLIGIFHFAQISVTSGKSQIANAVPQNASLQPGQWYCVRVKQPWELPAEAEWGVMGRRGPKFIHQGKQKDDKKKDCGGEILTLIQDSGYIKYKCLECGMEWDRNPEHK